MKYAHLFKFIVILPLVLASKGAISNGEIDNYLPEDAKSSITTIKKSAEEDLFFQKAQPMPSTEEKENRSSDSSLKKRLWNLQNADIEAVIAAMSKETGKNFLISPGVSGKITIISSQPIDADEAYQVFLSALEILGYSAVEDGQVIKIVPNANAKQTAPVAPETESILETEHEMIVQVVHVKNISAAQIAPILQPLLPDYGQISAYNATNTLILAGTVRDVERIKAIVKELDQNSSNDIDLVRLQHTSADKTVALIKSLQQADRALGRAIQVSLVADDQHNTILMTGTLEARLKMRVLISELDRPGKGGSSTRTFALNHLKAKDFAPILNKVVESTYANSFSASLDTKSKQKISVQAEEKTNTIIVSAPTTLFPTINSIIRKLDRQTRQVLVEAIIIEVNENISKILGTLWQADTANKVIDASTGEFNLSFKQITSGIIPGLQFRALFKALFTTGVSDILSRPSTVVLDNQPATIGVGSEVSIENQNYNQDQSGSGNFFSTQTRRPVELRLTVTPQISPNNSIQLGIEVKNDTLAANFNTEESQPINTSNIKTSVRVKSGDVVILGGLMRHDFSDNSAKLPGLGDIPVVNPAFKRRQKNVTKKELLVFIRPIVLDDRNSKEVLEEKYDHIREQQLTHYYEKQIIKSQDEIPLLLPYRKPPRIPKPFE
jgi:general secretion pathway protein D